MLSKDDVKEMEKSGAVLFSACMLLSFATPSNHMDINCPYDSLTLEVSYYRYESD